MLFLGTMLYTFLLPMLGSSALALRAFEWKGRSRKDKCSPYLTGCGCSLLLDGYCFLFPLLVVLSSDCVASIQMLDLLGNSTCGWVLWGVPRNMCVPSEQFPDAFDSALVWLLPSPLSPPLVALPILLLSPPLVALLILLLLCAVLSQFLKPCQSSLLRTEIGPYSS